MSDPSDSGLPPADAEIQRLVVESLAEGVMVTDAKAQIVSCNDSCMRILGLSRDEILGRRTVDPEWRTVREDGSPFPAEEYPAFLVLQDGVPRMGVIMGVHLPGGDLSWISINARPMLREGSSEAIGAVISFTDVTELRRTMDSLRESEERHRSLIAALAEGVLVLSHDGEITARNEAAASLFGLPAGRVVGPLERPSFSAVREDGSALPPEEFPGARVFATGKPQSGVVMGIDLPGTPRRWIQANAQPFGARRADGLPTSVVVSFSDLTAHVAAEEDRRRLEAQLLESQKLEAIGTLAGGIAHDFNNVLFAIQGNTEMARMELSDGHPAREGLTEALRACERAKALVQRILAFSRRQETRRRPLNIGPIVVETARLLRSALPDGVMISHEVAATLPLVISDEVEMQQVVLNLCTNAAHAMKDTGGEVRLRLDSVDLDESAARERGLGPGLHVRLSVTDGGPGIPAAILPRIFDPFFTTKPVGEGTGLGLAVVRQIVDSSNAVISATNAPGGGTTFEVLMPASTEREPADALAAARGVPRRANGERVLFVDDEIVLVRLADRLLSRVGFSVKAVSSAAAALEALREAGGRFDMVLSDVTMPRMSGLDLAAAIQREWPDLPVLLTTGNDVPMDLEAARQLGVREVIRKPWTGDQFLDAVFRHLG